MIDISFLKVYIVSVAAESKPARIPRQVTNVFVDQVRGLPHVRAVLAVEGPGSQTIWTVIDAPPSEIQPRTSVTDAEQRVVHFIPAPIDFRIINKQEVLGSGEPHSVVPHDEFTRILFSREEESTPFKREFHVVYHHGQLVFETDGLQFDLLDPEMGFQNGTLAVYRNRELFDETHDIGFADPSGHNEILCFVGLGKLLRADANLQAVRPFFLPEDFQEGDLIVATNTNVAEASKLRRFDEELQERIKEQSEDGVIHLYGP